MEHDIAMPRLTHFLDMTLREWVDYYQKNVVMSQVHYRGVPAWKNVLDLWVIQEIIHETQPEVVVEIGCKFGGTTLWLSETMKSVGSGTIVSVDLRRPSLELPGNVYFVEGDSVAAETVERVRSLCAGQRTMVMADGNHAADHVLKELQLYGPMVAHGCYFVVEDGIVDVMGWPEHQPGPLVAVQRFLAASQEFIADESREKFILSYAPGGFLRCVRT
ncbi:MAG: CmcI family methyltransferase [Verrucomicrobiota bacterium]